MNRIITCDKKKNKKQSRRKQLEGFKVVYISSPVKVKTCPSNFKTLVQELTGRHSDLSRFDVVDQTNHTHDHVDHDHKQYLSVVDLVGGGAGAGGDEVDSSTTSGASLESNNYFYRMDNNNNYIIDEESGDMNGSLSPFESMFDFDGLQNYNYIPTF